ncbi:TSUP family transporter [uncultured Parvibaculum sp.]|uniref:TSUP family transporter n=1 Tax=uncultured Parvibaculum sp. TaxID=291828 RepID=UPI0030ED4E0C|tara:strand:- start:11992 stop:12741 length:750 start_codon:yes stop_codon:yes gene_type:complete
MTATLAAVTALVVLVTATLSGIFGMAGGMVLMAFLVVAFPVGAAMMLHGVTQAVSNGYRAVINRRDIVWPLVATNMAGAAAALALFMMVSFVPDEATVLLVLGAIPFIAFAIPARWGLDITKPFVAPVCGFVVTALTLTAGVAGPILDVFFVRSPLTRHQIVATKAVTQTLQHLSKLLYFGVLAAHLLPEAGLPWWVYVMVAPLAMLGTTFGKMLLDRMNDGQFKSWSRYILFVLGAILIGRGLMLLVG